MYKATPRGKREERLMGSEGALKSKQGQSIIDKLASLHTALKNAYYGLMVLSTFLLFVVIALSCADIFGRYVLNRPVTGTLEVIEYAMVAIFFPGLAYIQATRGNIVVGMLTQRLNPAVRTVIQAFALAVGVFAFILVVWQNWLQTVYYFHNGAYSTMLRIPQYPFRFVVVVGAFFVGLEMLIQLVQTIARPFIRGR